MGQNRNGAGEGASVTQRQNSPLSPLDGRYSALVSDLAEVISEKALNRARLEVEVEWLISLTEAGIGNALPIDNPTVTALRARVTNFSDEDVNALAALEATTQHDVKAIEYFLRGILDDLGHPELQELCHFAATSEDINNLAYALMLTRAIHDVWLPQVDAVRSQLADLAVAWREIPMLSRTHGQPATPTTFGKELAVFAYRLGQVLTPLRSLVLPGKFNGATGTYSAHRVAWPEADWTKISQRFVENLGLRWNPLTTQIESHDGQVAALQSLHHAGLIAHNLCTDIWTYISLGYLRQVPQKGTTGSSTMPHKINPIRFENAEANCEIAAGLLVTLQTTLATSRLQRDLTDSTTQRNIAVAMGHQMVAWKNIQRGLSEIDVDPDRLRGDLEAHPEVLGEAIQTVIRAEIVAGRSSISDPYDVVKQLTRGKAITKDTLREFVSGLDIGQGAKERLLELTPESYTGLASELVDYLDS